MRKFSTIYLLFLIATLSFGCFDLFGGGSDTIVDDYEVSWVNLPEDRCLRKKERLVPAYVFAVGYNSKYIFAKQHPPLYNAEKIDRTTVNYYIIERTKNEFQDKPLIGPLKEKDFLHICAELGIESPEFSKTYSTSF